MKQNITINNIARVGMIAGWLTLAGIVLFAVIGPLLVAGPRVSGTLDATSTSIQAYYRHGALAYFAAAQFLIPLAFVPFALALRESLAGAARARFLAQLGLLFAIAFAPLLTTRSALQATLVTTATSGGDIVPLFRFWDMLYNSGLYAMAAGLTATFALAMRETHEFPRWMPIFGLVVGALQLVNLSALILGIADTVTLVGNLAFVVWFIGANIGLGRLAKQTRSAG